MQEKMGNQKEEVVQTKVELLLLKKNQPKQKYKNKLERPLKSSKENLSLKELSTVEKNAIYTDNNQNKI